MPLEPIYQSIFKPFVLEARWSGRGRAITHYYLTTTCLTLVVSVLYRSFKEPAAVAKAATTTVPIEGDLVHRGGAIVEPACLGGLRAFPAQNANRYLF